MPVFVDTNVLVYARDATELDKQQRAAAWMRELWSSGDGRLSTQVLAEFYVTVTRKLDPGLTPAHARADVEDLLAWDPIAVGGRLLPLAWSLEERFSLSFWDALIVAAAQVSDSTFLLTEDLQHSATYDGLTVVDPFRTPTGSLP